METKSLADAVVRIAEMFGLTGLIIMAASALIGLAIWRGRRGGTTREVVKAIAPDLTPMTCMFGEYDKREINEIGKNVDLIKADIAILKDRSDRKRD